MSIFFRVREEHFEHVLLSRGRQRRCDLTASDGNYVIVAWADVGTVYQTRWSQE